MSQPRNNPIHQFDRYSDIEAWLREQWAGLFRELINQRSKQTQISSLASQVSQLSEITRTLKRYLEEVVSKVSPEESKELIDEESERLEHAEKISVVRKLPFFRAFHEAWKMPYDELYRALSTSRSLDELLSTLIKLKPERESFLRDEIFEMPTVIEELNGGREELGLEPLGWESDKKPRKKK